MRSDEHDMTDLLAAAFAGDPADAGFDVHYQPIVRLGDGKTVAVEALVRWRHPTVGYVDPNVFVALAERTGLVRDLDNFVLDRACADAGALTAVYGKAVDLHVNVSAQRLGEVELQQAVAGALREYGLAPGRLVLGITETIQIRDLGAAASAVQRLQELGVRLALDNFGSGFNELLQLHALPVDFVKLGAASTRAVFDFARGAALCRAILAISAGLGALAIADGVETSTQADVLARMGCRLAQGRLYGAPLRLYSRRLPRPALGAR
jgi:diguanylate cyclase